ncbi:cytochrome P450 [Saccharopolyspora terrae]|uniref:Cytochrome P450 n=1 Tax=Saccharopolyspora terrae TaxID=2530384 RepID=A0A4R4VCV7_9PSEU|nr:cytochrome P450 [Saccharopolyspora terrae]TDD03328.1 cytochrome P450 [Saccharopolyspora terrae]
MTSNLTDLSLADPQLWQRRDRLEVFAQLRRDHPVSWHEEPKTDWFPEGGRGFWSLVRYDDVVAASKNQELFTSDQGTEIVDMEPEMQHIFGGMLNMTGDEHTRHRSIVNRVLTPRTVERMTDNIRTHARRCILRIADRGSADFMADLVGDFPAQIICELLGVPVADRPRLIELTNTALSGYGTADAYGAVLEIVDYAQTLLRQVGDAPAPDAGFLAKLLAAKIDGQSMSSHEIAVFFALLVTAGIETTTTSIGQGMLALSRYPETRRRWQADYDGLARIAVEEIVRWTSPVMHFRRTATRDVELHGRRIRKGDKVVLWYISANGDESVFPSPERLDFDRGEQQHAGFGGGGPHFCLGAVLARKEITVFFRELFEILPDIDVSGEPVPLVSNFVNGLQSLPVSFTPRNQEEVA